MSPATHLRLPLLSIDLAATKAFVGDTQDLELGLHLVTPVVSEPSGCETEAWFISADASFASSLLKQSQKSRARGERGIGNPDANIVRQGGLEDRHGIHVRRSGRGGKTGTV